MRRPDKHSSIHDRFDEIIAACSARPIVFLLGAGVSVSAGIPLTSGICDYLNHVDLLRTLMGWQTPRDFLLTYGWPKRHELPIQLQITPDVDNNNVRLRSAANVRQRLQERMPDFMYSAMLDDLRSPHVPAAALLTSKAMKECWGSDNAASPDYRALLSYMCGGDLNLIDAFFDRLVRDRTPATTHQFIAFLVRQLRMKLVLTTNFDDLIEISLRDEGEHPIIYELNRHDAVMPHHSVVSKHLSVVKLHGGTYGVRTGFDLDRPLTGEVLATLESYLPPRCLLIVLGYSGGDGRVMSFIQHLAAKSFYERRTTQANEPAIVWVHRDEAAPAVVKQANDYACRLAAANGVMRSSDTEPIMTITCRDGRLFFQELYQRMTYAHAPSRSRYRAILHTPRKSGETPPADLSQIPAQSKVILFTRRLSIGRGTSSRLAQFTQQLEDCRQLGYQLIWIDCAELHTRTAFVDILLDEFRRHDRWLAPASMPPFLHDLPDDEADAQFHDPKSPRILPGRSELDSIRKAVDAITFEMRRGRYVIAVDSLGEFASDHLAELNPDASARVSMCTERLHRFKQLLDFLQELILQHSDFGESRLCLALTPPAGFDSQPNALKEHWNTARDHFVDLFTTNRQPDLWLQCIPSSYPGRDGRRLEELLSEESNQHAARILLAVASAFRRPRSFVGLVTIATRIIKGSLTAKSNLRCILQGLGLTRNAEAIIKHAKKQLEVPETIDKRELLHRVSADVTIEKILAKAIEWLAARTPEEGLDPILIRQEGGYFWMHASHRDLTYKYFRKKEHAWMDSRSDADKTIAPDSDEVRALEPLAELHHLIANYYHDDLFEKSKDLLAYVEYLFHRKCSIGRPDERVHFLWKRRRYRWLVASVERELDGLMAGGRASPLLYRLGRLSVFSKEWLRALEVYRKDHADDPFVAEAAAELRNLQARVSEAQAEIWRNVAAFDRAGAKYSQLLIDSFRTLTGNELDTEANPLTRINVASLLTMLKTELDQRTAADRIAHSETAIFLENATRALGLALDVTVCADGPYVLGPADNREQSRNGQGAHGQNFVQIERLAHDIWETFNKYASQQQIGVDGHNSGRRAQFGYRQRQWVRDAIRMVWLRATYRLVDHWLRSLYPWGKEWSDDPSWPKSPLVDFSFEAATKHCVEADRHIRACPPSDRARRFKCYNYTLRARLAYFQKNFVVARMYLSRARAAASRSDGAADKTAYGVVCLHDAEMLILESRHLVALRANARSMKRKKKGQLDDGTAPDRRQHLLADALRALHDAEVSMRGGRRDHFWWPIYFMLRARVRIEQLYFSPFNPERLRGMASDEAFLDGLFAIRSAVDNLPLGDARNVIALNLKDELARCWTNARRDDDGWNSMQIRAGGISYFARLQTETLYYHFSSGAEAPINQSPMDAAGSASPTAPPVPEPNPTPS
jgi:hypothetical protein